MSRAGEDSIGVQAKQPDRCSPEGREKLTLYQWGAVTGAGHEWRGPGGAGISGGTGECMSQEKWQQLLHCS